MLARMSAQHRVLLVEDDAALARGLVEGLRRDNYDVTHHISGEAAIAAARSQPPQVVILDVRLPDISGFDVCRRMRQLGLRMPILILTAQGDDTDKVLGLELGADDYVTKPCSLRELSSRVRAQLRRAYGELSTDSASLLHAGDITLDLARTQATRSGRVIDLSPTEFRLRAFFARNAGQSLSRAQLVDNVWGFTADPDSDRTVTVTINRLRQRSSQTPATPA
jgi:DNA-binding response OmpR family regulator